MPQNHPKLRIWSLRKALLRIHRDLFRIDEFVLPVYGEGPLSEFEKLVLILEDKRFFKHPGIDVASSLRALAHSRQFSVVSR